MNIETINYYTIETSSLQQILFNVKQRKCRWFHFNFQMLQLTLVKHGL